MGASQSNHCAYEYGFPARKRRQMLPSSESNHFDKNYLIEGSEFWAERRYREDCYGYARKGSSKGRENYSEIYAKTRTEYGSWTYSGGAQPPHKAAKDAENVAPVLMAAGTRGSLHSVSGGPATGLAARVPGTRPPGIQPKYLPSFG